MKQYILGISAFYHDSAAALIKDGAIVAAAQEERFTRKKHDPSFPTQAIRFCLDQAGIAPQQLTAVVFYDKPFLKFERLLETYYLFSPKGLRSFLAAIPIWIKEKIFLKKRIVEELDKIGILDLKQTKLLFSEHHLSHAASAYYPSPFSEAAIVTIDGVGEWATASIGKGSGNTIEMLKELRFPHSLGLLYSAFTYYLGFRVNSGEYKLMGLAPYGNPTAEEVRLFKEKIKTSLADIRADGSLFLNQDYFNYATGLTMTKDSAWEKLFGVKRRKPETELTQQHCNLALAIQQVTEEIVLKIAVTAKQLTGSNNLCLAGGVALNCVANAKLLEAGIFKHIWIQPAAGDAGGALGAALAVYYQYEDMARPAPNNQDAMAGAYLGPEFSDQEAIEILRSFHAKYIHFETFSEVAKATSDLLAQGKIVGWVQGKMEWGPRALGNRSILGDARDREMQKRMNLKIKYRESFRPFAPAVLSEDVKQYFEAKTDSPYMLLTAPVTKKRRKLIPESDALLPLLEKLYRVRSDIPAVTHLDFSARLQTVHADTNPKFHELLNTFKKKTGFGVLVNTSFNVRGEPIVCTPGDAYRCFMRTEIDALVIGNLLCLKSEQPAWPEPKTSVQETHGLD